MSKRKKRKKKREAPEGEQVPSWVPTYTQSLDASVPEENIVSVHYDEASSKWIAVNKRPSGRYYVGIGNTEVLARRIAGLKAIQATKEGKELIDERQREILTERLVTALEDLAAALRNNNEYAANEPQDRNRRLSEIKAALDLLKQPGSFTLAAVVLLLTTLNYLAIKFTDALIGKLSDQAIIYLELLLGS